MTRNAADLARGLAVELGVTPRRVAEATVPRRRGAPARGRGVKISSLRPQSGGAGESMHPDETCRPPYIHLAQPATTADRRTP